jgi:hypothetical protein
VSAISTVFDPVKIPILETGQELTVYGVRALETAGTGGSARLVAYRRDPICS